MTPSFFSAADTGRKNMLQLIRLRWIAVAGQLLSIACVYAGLHIHLPLLPMLAAIGVLILMNGISYMLCWRHGVSHAEIFAAVFMDILVLTWQLYFSGGATNPFIMLYLLQIILGSILLGIETAWLFIIITASCFLLLTVFYHPLVLPPHLIESWSALYLQGSLLCFVLMAVLLVWFISRINRNLRDLDNRLATLRQNAAEEDLIVRMGLLASGAAHELGTPLSSLSVILSDWKRMPDIADNPERMQEIADMQAEVKRCKSIVTGILLAAGEVRGESPTVTSIHALLTKIVADWQTSHNDTVLDYCNQFGDDKPIISDPVLEKVIFNVLDNAFEASPHWVGLTAKRADDALVLSIADNGPGFIAEILDKFGKPYQSTKGRTGGGLGLFLVVNVMRKLGGMAEAFNRPEGGACVVLKLPLSTLTMAGRADGR